MNAQFWVDVLCSFKDDSFHVGQNIRAGDPRFQDRAGNPVDISKCLSPWATTDAMHEWFNGAQNAVANYRKGFDKSGGHDFDLEGLEGPGFELFCSQFCNSMMLQRQHPTVVQQLHRVKGQGEKIQMTLVFCCVLH
jgi:hypothetical protein